jgi:hypothetical protein
MIAVSCSRSHTTMSTAQAALRPRTPLTPTAINRAWWSSAVL